MPEIARTATLTPASAENRATTLRSRFLTNEDTAHKQPTHALIDNPCATDEVKARE